MKLKEFNQKIENLRNYFDACLFELRTKEKWTQKLSSGLRMKKEVMNFLNFISLTTLSSTLGLI